MVTCGAPGRSTTSLATVLFAVFAVTIGSQAAQAQSDDKSGQKEPAKVDLPEPPPDSAFDVQKRNSDGTFRVRGLIAHRGQHLGDKIEVEGIVTHISPECGPTRAKENGEECPEPYLYIRDDKEADDALMIVAFDRERMKKAGVEEGSEHVFEGSYKELAQGFVRTKSGLLVVDTVDDTDVVGGDR